MVVSAKGEKKEAVVDTWSMTNWGRAIALRHRASARRIGGRSKSRSIRHISPGSNPAARVGVLRCGLRLLSIFPLSRRPWQLPSSETRLRVVTMPPLESFQLPLSSPPSGYAWSDHSLLTLSGRSGFDTGVDERDRFLGRRSCIVCGNQISEVLKRSHIIQESEPDVVSCCHRFGIFLTVHVVSQ